MSWLIDSSVEELVLEEVVTLIVLVCCVPKEPVLVWEKSEVWFVKSGDQLPKVSWGGLIVSSPASPEEQE